MDSLQWAPTTVADTWAMAGAIANVCSALIALAVLIVAIKGLRSLGLTKKDMVTRATRESRTCAIERCREMAEVLIPLNALILKDLQGKPVFIESAHEAVFDSPAEGARVRDAKAWVSKLDPDLVQRMIGFLNRLETWAAFTNQKLVDEETVYGPCGPVYFSLVMEMYPLLIAHRSFGGGQYPNIVAVFKRWIEMHAAAAQHIHEVLKSNQARGMQWKFDKGLGTDG